MEFIDDFFLLEDNSYKRKIFIMGSVKNNTSVIVNYKQFKIISEIYNITRTIDLKMTEEKIEEAVWDRLKFKINLCELKNQLHKIGLLKDSIKCCEQSEAEMMGITIFKSTFTFVPKIIKKVANFFIFMKWLEYLIIIIGILIFAINFNYLFGILENHLFIYKNSSIRGFGMSILISLIVIFIHEIAHVLEAIRNEMDQGEFHFILYAGFIPMYYTKYPQFIKLKGKCKIAILSAGLRTNFAMLFLSLIFMLLPCSDQLLNILGLSILVNLNFIIINISPFSLNDGYFILMTRLGLGSVRVKMWKFITNFLKRSESANISIRNKFFFLGYTLISLCFIVLNLFMTIEWIKRIVAEIMNFI